ncbi:hypothetical protein RB195_004854 [Necator americanus]|uniref:WW domain-containing protein n=2 Tax=Necator americanus TaxID=51031 RepID=A0ABR1BPB5_NECAM
MVKEIKEFGPWSEQTSSSGRKYFYNRDTEVSQWEKPKEWREYEQRLAEQERLAVEQERLQQQVQQQQQHQQQQHAVVPPPPMFMTPPPFAFPPPFAPPGFAVGPMNAPPPPFPPYNQFQTPPNLPYPIPPRINPTINPPINTSFLPPHPPHPPAAPSPRMTQSIPPSLIPPIVNVSTIPPSPHVNAHFSPIQYSAPPPTTVPPPAFTSVPQLGSTAPHFDGLPVHAKAQPPRVQQTSQTSQQSSQPQHHHTMSHSTPSFSRDRGHVEKSPRTTATPPSTHSHQRHGNAPAQVSHQQTLSSQVKAEPVDTKTIKKERDKGDEPNEKVTTGRDRPSTETSAQAGPTKRERTNSDDEENASPSPATDESEKPPAKKPKEEDAATSWRTFYNAELARQKEAELNLDIDPEMRDLVAQSLTLENKLVAELIKMKTAAALVAVQENEVCICNAKIQSLREMRNDLENRQSRLMAPAVVTMPDLNSRA